MTDLSIQQVYDYLGRVRSLEQTIWRLCLQHDELQSCLLPAAIRYDKDKVQTSPEDKLSSVAASVLDLEKRIRMLKAQKAALIIEISSTIDQLTDERERVILSAFYVGRISIEKIANEIGYSPSYVYRLRRHGVRHLGEILGKRG